MQSQLSSTLVLFAALSALSVGCYASSLLSGPSTSLPEPATDSVSWSSQQGNCQHWFTGRRTLTAADRATVSSLTSHNGQSSCSKSVGTTGSCTAGTLSAQSDSWCPALLWTFTGTGNTMTRMLVEAASGWYTGSVYTDLSLVDLFPGEYLCNNSVIAVKAHPQWHSFASLSPEGLRPDTPQVPPDAKPICPCAYNRAVAVIRDPYATFVAEYKRLKSHDYSSCSHVLAEGQECKGGHVSVLHKADFNATDFRVEALRLAAEWAAMFESYDAFAAAHPRGFYLTTFENLTSPQTRMPALAELLTALGVPQDAPRSSTDTAACAATDAASADSLAACSLTDTLTGEQGPGTAGEQQQEDKGDGEQGLDELKSGAANGHTRGLMGYDQERLQCAFQLARHPSILRRKDPEGIDMGYVYSSDHKLVCDIWAVVGPRAAAHGYSRFGGVQC